MPPQNLLPTEHTGEKSSASPAFRLVFRTLEVKFALGVVLPLVELLRAQVAAIESRSELAGQVETQHDDAHRRAVLPELRTLLDLFHPDFPATETVTIGRDEAPAILRACSYLRLGLRRGKLASLSDQAMEATSTEDTHPENLRDSLRSYAFLATLQTVILSHASPASAHPSPVVRWLHRVQNYFSPLRADHVEPPKWTSDTEVPPVDASWQVVVHNDPVNLMAYVTAVFELVLGLPPALAQQRMREVHEVHRSIVWQGSRQKAEAHARTLRAWHLKAEALPA